MEEVLVDFADSGTQVFHVGAGSVAVPGLLQVSRRPTGASRPATGPTSSSMRSTSRARAWRATSRAPSCTESSSPDPAPRRSRPARLRRSRPCRYRGSPRDARAGSGRRCRRRRRAPARVRGRSRQVPGRGSGAAGDRACSGAASFAAPPPSRGGAHRCRDPRALPRRIRAVRRRYGRRPRARLPRVRKRQAHGNDAHLRRGRVGKAAALSSTLGSGSGVFRGGAQMNNMLGELDVIGHEPRARRDAPPDAC